MIPNSGDMKPWFRVPIPPIVIPNRDFYFFFFDNVDYRLTMREWIDDQAPIVQGVRYGWDKF